MDRRIPLDSVFSTLYLVGMSESKQQDRRQEMGASERYSVRYTCGVHVTLMEGSWAAAVRCAVEAYRRGDTPIVVTDLVSGEVVATHAAIGEWVTWDALRRSGSVAS